MEGDFPILTGMKEKGFTLIELLVSITIIGIVTTITFANLRGGNETLALERAAKKVAQDIRRAAELALQSEQGVACGGGGSLSGYGVYFNQGDTSYILYANCTGVDPGEGYTSSGGVFDEVIETIELEHRVFIQSTSTGNHWSVAFFPPDPTVVRCSSDPCNGSNELEEATLTLGLNNDTGMTKLIQVNEVGLVDID